MAKIHIIETTESKNELKSCKAFFYNNKEVLEDLENSELKNYRISFDNVPSEYYTIVSDSYYYVQSERGWAAYPTDQFELEEAVKLEFEIEIEE